MKKIVAILLVAIMALSAVITVSAETGADTSAAPAAPTLVGFQVGDYVNADTNEKEDGYVNIRFVSYVNSLEGDMLGYNIEAYFTKKDADGNVTGGGHNTFAATDDPKTTTEYNKVFTSIIANNKVVPVTDYNKDAKGFFLYSIKKIPANYDIYFEVTAYVKVGDEIVSVSERQIFNYDADNTVKGGIVSNTTDFSDPALTPAYYGAQAKHTDVGQYRLENDKLVISKGIKWAGGPPSNCFTSLLSSEKLGNALRNGDGYYQSYVVSMDLVIPWDTKISTFAIYLNADNILTSNNTMRANAMGVRMFPTSGKSNTTTTGNNIGINPYVFDSSSALVKDTSSGDYTNYGKSVAVTASHETTGIGFNLAIAYTHNENGKDARMDVYADGTLKASYVIDTTKTEAGLKFDDQGNLLSDVLLYAENISKDITVDNLTVSVPADESKGVVDLSGDTPVLNELKTTYSCAYNNLANYGIVPTVDTTAANAAALSITEDGQLKISGGSWKNHLITLADADKINADNGKVVVDMKLTMNSGNRLSVFLVNTPALSEAEGYLDVTNTGAVGFRLSAEADNTLKNWFVTFDSSGTQISGEGVKGLNSKVSGDSYTFDIRIVADGTTYSLYVNGVHCVTNSYSGDTDKVINENTSLVLWAQGTEVLIDDLTISTLVTAE